MDPNPFADLIPAAANAPNPFADLIPQAPPAAPMSGWSPEQIEELNRRQPRVEQRPSLGEAVSQAFTEASEDPVGALARSVGKITGSNKLARDVYALPQALGPLGAVEFGFAAPRVPRPPQTSGAMPKTSVSTQAELKTSGAANLTQAKASEATVEPLAMQESVGKFKGELDKIGLEIDPDLHPTAAKVLRKVELATEQPQTLKQLHALRQKVQAVIDDGIGKTGKPNQEGKIGMMMKSSVDDMIAKHPEGAKFMQGIGEYARSEKSDIIEQAIDRAKVSPLWTSGNQSAAIQNEFRTLYRNKAYRNTWTPAEKTEIRKVAARGPLGLVGTLAPRGIVSMTLGRVLEGALGLPFGSTAVAGEAAKHMQNARVLARAEGVGEMIRAAGPVEQGRLDQLAKVLSPNVLKHVAKDAEGAKRVQAWITSPSAQTARALSTYTAAKLKVPEMALRIAQQIQGTDQSEAHNGA